MEDSNKTLMEILQSEQVEELLAQKAYDELLMRGDYLIRSEFTIIEDSVQFYDKKEEEWVSIKLAEIEPSMDVKFDIDDVFGRSTVELNNVQELAIDNGEIAIHAENGFCSSILIDQELQVLMDQTPLAITDNLGDIFDTRQEIIELKDDLRERAANAELDLAVLWAEYSGTYDLEEKEIDELYNNKGSLDDMAAVHKKYAERRKDIDGQRKDISESIEQDRVDTNKQIAEKEAEIEQLKSELKFLRENRPRLTRDDLMEILKMDGTLDEIKQAIEAKELTDAEQEQIFKFLEAPNKEEADKAFKEIIENVDKIPTFDAPQEERDAWKNIRKDLVKDIADVNNRRLLQEVAYEGLEKECERFNQFIDIIKNDQNAAEIDATQNSMQNKLIAEKTKLDIATYQHSALGLMHAHAKSEERQASAKVFALESQPYRDFLKQSWDGLTDLTRRSTEYVKDTYLQVKEQVDLAKEHAHNRKDALKSTKRIDVHPIENMKNKMKLAWADHLVKKSNREKAHAHKQEQAIIKKAEKILNKGLKKEFDRKERQERLDAYGRGEKYHFDPKKFTPIKTASIKEAIEIVKDSKNPWTKIQCSIYKNTKRNGLRHEKEMLKNLEQIASNISRRQENVRNIYKDIAAHQRAGDYGNGHKKFHDQLDQNYKDAQRSNTFGQSEFSGALRKAMEDHGYDFMIDHDR